MKKALALVLALLMTAALLAGCGGGSAATTPAPASSDGSTAETAAPADNKASDEVVTLKLAHNVAASSITGEQYHALATLIEEESGGSIKVEEFTAGSLITDADALDAIMDGTCDFAHGMVAYMDGIIKDMIPLEIPGYYAGSDFMTFSNTVQPVLEDICADYGVKFIGCNYQGQAAFVGSKTIKAPADLKGLAVRAAGTYISKAVEAWGGAPTQISLPDLTTALERSTVDTAYTGWTVVGGFKLYEMGKEVTITTITESFGCCMMSMDSYNKLSADQQAAIDRAAERWRQATYDVGAGYKEQYISDMEASGANVYQLTAEETKPFIELTSPMFDEIEGQLGEKGLTLLNTLKELNG